MKQQHNWIEVLLQALYCGVTKEEGLAVKKLILNKRLKERDVYHLTELVSLCPIGRLDTMEEQDFHEFLEVRMGTNE